MKQVTSSGVAGVAKKLRALRDAGIKAEERMNTAYTVSFVFVAESDYDRACVIVNKIGGSAPKTNRGWQ